MPEIGWTYVPHEEAERGAVLTWMRKPNESHIGWRREGASLRARRCFPSPIRLAALGAWRSGWERDQGVRAFLGYQLSTIN
jgi:hypothetical protein